MLYPVDSLGNLGSKTAYERVHRGVMWALWHHDTPGIVSLNRLHVLALFELNTLLYGITTVINIPFDIRASPLITP